MDQEFVVAASLAIGEIPANFWSGLINGAATRFGIEEAAHRSVMLIRLVAQHARVFLVTFFGELSPRLFWCHVKVLGETFDVALLDRDMLIGTAISRALHAVV